MNRRRALAALLLLPAIASPSIDRAWQVARELRPKMKRMGVLIDETEREPYLEAVKMTSKILHGARPADMPVQLVGVIHTSINLRTAKAMKIAVPASVLAAADLVFP